MDQRLVCDGPLVYFTNHHGGHHVRSAATKPAADRSDAGQDDEDHAACVCSVHAVLPSRFGALLDSEQLVQHGASALGK